VRKLLYKEVGDPPLSRADDLVVRQGRVFYFTNLGKRMPRHKVYGGVYYACLTARAVTEVVYPS